MSKKKFELPHTPNELHPDLLGVNALNPWPGHDSSSRAVMMSSHIGQALVVKDADVRRCQTGVEREYARHTFAIRMPCDALIIRTINKYPKQLGEKNVKENPITAVVYEDVGSDHREIGLLELNKFHCNHQQFGFRYDYKPVASKLVPGQYIPKGTVIADSPSVTETGDYKFGVETQVAMMSYQPVIEDGVIASDAYCKRLATKAYGKRVVSWGKDSFPLNLYGDENEYKPFPDIGEFIRSDGLLFAMRSYDELMAPVHMTPQALRKVDHVFDRTIYAEKAAKVIDVVVYKGNQPKSNMPSGMTEQTEKYFRKEKAYYEALLQEWKQLKRTRGDHLRVTPEFHRMLVEAIAFVGDDKKEKVNKTVNRNPLDEWCVEITFEYEMVPTIGSKITDLHGG